jgi:hypothetical protein
MKQKDIALIIVIVFISGVFSLAISKLVFATPGNRSQQVEVVQPIVAKFNEPDTKYYNKDAFDPTKPISIGQNANPNPFNGKSGQ